MIHEILYLDSELDNININFKRVEHQPDVGMMTVESPNENKQARVPQRSASLTNCVAVINGDLTNISEVSSMLSAQSSSVYSSAFSCTKESVPTAVLWHQKAPNKILDQQYYSNDDTLLTDDEKEND